MVRVAHLAALLPMAAAFPTAMQMDSMIKKRAAPPKTDGRVNTGLLHPDPPFDAQAQYVDVSDDGPNPFIAPICGVDRRGECPGLNAAANHGFLPRNGLPTLADTITGLGAAYNMGPDLAGVLAVISILDSGDIPTLTWSIGGKFAPSIKGLLGTPTGILGTHDRYEGDASITRQDAYLADGNVNYFRFGAWENLYGLTADNLTFGRVADHDNYVTTYSIENNPYYFSGPFSGIVAPAAHNFVVTFFSNHSAEVPGGFLDKEVLKTFFAVTGEPGSFVWHKDQERIPYNWYKRPGGLTQPGNDYDNADVFADVIANALLYPNTLRIGGNTGKVNTFTGVSLTDFTGGVFNTETLLQGDNLACFFFQVAANGQLDELDANPTLAAPLTSALSSFSCPQEADFDFGVFDIYPGYKYHPASQETCPALPSTESPTATATPTGKHTRPTGEPTGEPTTTPPTTQPPHGKPTGGHGTYTGSSTGTWTGKATTSAYSH